MISTRTFHGTTRSISSRNSRLRVFFVERFRLTAAFRHAPSTMHDFALG